MNTSDNLIVEPLAPGRLRGVVDGLKRGDGLAPVTVVGPSNYANLSLRHEFARAGFVNVRFMVFSRLAEFLGAPRMARDGRTPLTRVLENAAVRAVAAGALGPLGELRGHPSTLHSLKQSFRDLRGVSGYALDALAGSGELQAETVRLYRQFRRDTARFYDDEDLARAAAESVDGQPAAGFGDLGAVVFYAPRDLTPGQVTLVEALARRGRCVVMLDRVGDGVADGYVDTLVNRLSPVLGASSGESDGDRYSPSPRPSPSRERGMGSRFRGNDDLRVPTPVSPEGEGGDHARTDPRPGGEGDDRGRTHLMVAPDPHQEIRWVIGQIVNRARRGTPFSRVAVLYRKPDYGKIVAEEMELAGVPVSGPDRSTLAESAVGRALVGLMELADGDFQRGAVTSWLTGCPVRSPVRSVRLNPSRWDKLSKEAGIVRGIGQWRDRLQKYAARQEESVSDPAVTEEMSEGRLRGVRAQAESARDLLAFVERLYDDVQPPTGGNHPHPSPLPQGRGGRRGEPSPGWRGGRDDEPSPQPSPTGRGGTSGEPSPGWRGGRDDEPSPQPSPTGRGGRRGEPLSGGRGGDGTQDEGASWADFSAWARQLVDDYVSRGAGTPERELDALERVQDILSELTAASVVAPRATFQAFREELYEALQAPAGRLGEMGKGVFVAPFGVAAAMRFDAVYLVGMIEGAVPPATWDDPLIPESARQRAGGSSAGFETQQDARARERRDYLSALGSAQDRTLSFPLADPSAGREQHPSRWMLEQASYLGVSEEERGVRGEGSLSSLLNSHSSFVTVIPSAESALSDGDAADASDVLDYDLRHLLRWKRDGRRVRGHPFAEMGTLRRALNLGIARNGSNFTEWDGNLVGVSEEERGERGARQSRFRSHLLTAGFSNRPLAPTRLERWAACPFSYFLGNVLRIGSVETPEDVFSISALERGSLVHKILDEFMRSVAESGTMPTPHETWSAEHRDALFRIAQERFARAESDGVTGRPVMWEIERAQILADLDTFLERDAALRARFGVTPRAFEVGFGLPDGSWQEAVWSLDGSERVRFRGVIDRVDTSPDGRTALVIDYKTGSPRPYSGLENDPTDRGRRLQLGVYALAADGGLERVENVLSAYWFVTTRGGFALAPKEPVDGSSEKVRGRLGEVVGGIVSGIRGGVFPANPGGRNARFGFENCGFCEFDSLCPSRRDRMWDRKRGAPMLAGYRDLVGE